VESWFVTIHIVGIFEDEDVSEVWVSVDGPGVMDKAE